MTEFLFSVPMYVDIPRKTKKDKRIYLNMNVDRNLHYQIKNKVKKSFQSLVAEKTKGIKFDVPVVVEYFLYYGDYRDRDFHNVFPIVNKYVLDALQASLVIENDNQKFVKGVLGWYGGVLPNYPRS